MNREEKFWKRVKKTETCWNWIGPVNIKGYGLFMVDGQTEKAHRYSYKLHHGKDPGNKLVCHTCDNPGCIRPTHLWLGTNAENQADSIAKGRDNGPPKLFTEEQELEIARRWRPYQNTKSLAEEYNTHTRMITRIGNQHGIKRGGFGANSRKG